MLHYNNIGFYIHYPFCQSICPYCDFNSYVKKEISDEQILNAYINEINYFRSQVVYSNVKSIYFGGGTPSLMSLNLIEKLLNHIEKNFTFDNNIEITIEANPTTFELEKFQNFKKIGINRISLGVQSLDDKELIFLGRKHNKKETLFAIDKIKNIFTRYNFDLIYALPNQTFSQWEKNLKFAIDFFDTNHISLYTLTIENNTPFYRAIKNGRFKEKTTDEVAEFIDLTNHIMINNYDFEQYEISNYAKNKDYSKHNMCYWKNYDYIGIGAGAHGRITIDNSYFATKIKDSIKIWLNKDTLNKIELIKLDINSKIIEIIIFGLRVNSGIDFNDIYTRFNIDLKKYFNSEKIYNITNTDVMKQIDSELAFFFLSNEDKKCPKCQDGKEKIALGKFGAFITCTNYPKCKFIESISSNDKEFDSNTEDKKSTFEEKIFEFENYTITLKKGKFGIYLEKNGKKNDKDKKNYTIPKNIDLKTIDEKIVNFYTSLPKKIGIYEDMEILINIGRFGPYISWNKRFFSIKNIAIDKLQINDAIEIISVEKDKKAKAKSAFKKTK